MKPSKTLLFLAAFAFGLSRPSAFEGEVTAVIEGDVIEVTSPDGLIQVQVRLEGIDCPEKGQEYSKISKRFTSQSALRTHVRVEETGREDGMVIARVYLTRGRNLAEELVKSGMAWWDRVNYPELTALADLEREARARYAGLWGEEEPTAPWIYRSRQSAPASGNSAAPIPTEAPHSLASDVEMAAIPIIHPTRFR